MVDRGSSKHSPRADEQLEEETENITHAGQPAHTEEWRQTEPFDEGHLSVPDDEVPGTPVGMSDADVQRRADIAIWLPPGKLPADRDTILGYLNDTGAPDGVIDAISGLPDGQEFGTIGDIARALGIPTEQPRDRG